MGLDGQRAKQRWVGPGTVCKFPNPTANNQYEVGCRNLHTSYANTLGPNVWVAILFRRHPYIRMSCT